MTKRRNRRYRWRSQNIAISQQNADFRRIVSSLLFYQPIIQNRCSCKLLVGLIDKQSMMYVCDTNRVRMCYLQTANESPTAIRPLVLSLMPSSTATKLKNLTMTLSEEEEKVRNLSYLYHILLQDDMMIQYDTWIIDNGLLKIQKKGGTVQFLKESD